jgi:hypothetical protein
MLRKISSISSVENLIFNKGFIAGVSAPVKECIFCLLDKESGTKKRKLALSRI